MDENVKMDSAGWNNSMSLGKRGIQADITQGFNLLAVLPGDIDIDDDDGDADDDEGERGGAEGAEAILCDFQYQLKCQFMERGRNLRVAWLYSRHLFRPVCTQYGLTSYSHKHTNVINKHYHTNASMSGSPVNGQLPA